jgi:hypothetical protein
MGRLISRGNDAVKGRVMVNSLAQVVQGIQEIRLEYPLFPAEPVIISNILLHGSPATTMSRYLLPNANSFSAVRTTTKPCVNTTDERAVPPSPNA